MARIRTIKPELPEDETLGACTRDARLLFILLWTRCDDHGRFRAAPALLRSLFPYDEDVTAQMVGEWLTELAESGRVELYEIESQKYGVIVNWTKHQRIDNAGKPLYPDPPNDAPASLAAVLGESPRVAAGPGPRPRPRTKEGTTNVEPDPPAANPDLWITMAEREFSTAVGVKNPAKWKEGTAKNLEKEHGQEASRYLSEYPDITITQLADVLKGNKSILRLLRKADVA